MQRDRESSERTESQYFETPLKFEPGDRVDQNLYLLYQGNYVLIASAGSVWKMDDTVRLRDFGVEKLWIKCKSWMEYNSIVERRIKMILNDHSIPVARKARTVLDASLVAASELFNNPTSLASASATIESVDHCIQYLAQDKDAFVELFKASSENMTEHNHGVHSTAYAITLAKALGYTDSIDLRSVALGAMFHDLGKAYVPRSILDKPGKLTEEEMAIVREHPTHGYEILSAFPHIIPELARTIVIQHHEKPDGTGYPQGLRGDDIHPLARVVRIVDIFDSMTAKRTYKDQTKAIDSLKEMIGEAYDQVEKQMIIAFIAMMKS